MRCWCWARQEATGCATAAPLLGDQGNGSELCAVNARGVSTMWYQCQPSSHAVVGSVDDDDDDEVNIPSPVRSHAARSAVVESGNPEGSQGVG